MAAPVRSHEAFGLNSQEQQLLWWDDFLGDILDDRWDVTITGAGSATVIDAQTGGIVRIATGGTDNDQVDVDWAHIRSLHVDQKVCMEFRIKVSSTDKITAQVNLFFDNNNRILFEADNSAANWNILCIDAGVAAEDSGIAFDTDYHIFRIETTATSVAFFIDDVECNNSPITTNIPDDAGDYLEPRFTVLTKDNSIKSIDVDYVVVREER